MKGIPAASWTLAWSLTDDGMSGFSVTLVRNDAVRAAIRIDPASAVPMAAPRFVAVFCRPPTSPLNLSGRPRR